MGRNFCNLFAFPQSVSGSRTGGEFAEQWKVAFTARFGLVWANLVFNSGHENSK
jgi:hypothetical protein